MAQLDVAFLVDGCGIAQEFIVTGKVFRSEPGDFAAQRGLIV